MWAISGPDVGQIGAISGPDVGHIAATSGPDRGQVDIFVSLVGQCENLVGANNDYPLILFLELSSHDL